MFLLSVLLGGSLIVSGAPDNSRKYALSDVVCIAERDRFGTVLDRKKCKTVDGWQRYVRQELRRQALLRNARWDPHVDRAPDAIQMNAPGTVALRLGSVR